jgi:hypothetical protein
MLISLVDSGVGVAILPASAVKRSVASVVEDFSTTNRKAI